MNEAKLSKLIDLLAVKLDEHQLTELRFKDLQVSRQVNVSAPVGGMVMPAAGETVCVSHSASTSTADAEKSPMVGVFYSASEPGAEPFVKVGSSVKAGDTICLIEAMKTFNPVKAVKSGTVKEILVKDGDTVEFGTPIMIIA